MGRYYEFGWGTDINLSKAKQLYEKAADEGVPQGLFYYLHYNLKKYFFKLGLIWDLATNLVKDVKRTFKKHLNVMKKQLKMMTLLVIFKYFKEFIYFI